MEGAIRRVPAMADAGVSRVINGPEAFTPDNEFILGESEVRGFFVAAGFSAHGIAGAGGIGRQMATWIVDRRARAGPLEDGHPAIRGGLPFAGYTLARSIENYATYYDIHYPNEERQAGRPLRISPAYRCSAELGAVVRREVGLGAAELVRDERDRRRRRVAPAARLGRPPLVAGHRRRGAGHPEDGRAVRREQLRQDRGQRSGCHWPSCSGCAPTTSTGRSARIVYTQTARHARRHRGRPDGHARWPRAVPARHRDRRRAATTSAWLRKHLPTDGSVAGARRHVGAGVCFGLWGPRARDILAPLTRDDLSDAAFPYLTAREITLGSVPVWRCASPMSASWAGSCTRRPSTARALADALGRRAASTGWWPAGTAPSTRSGSRRAIASGRATSPRRRRPTRPGSGSRSRSTSPAASSAATRSSPAKAAGPRKRLRCLVLDDPLAVCLGNEPVRLGGRDRGPRHLGRVRLRGRELIAYAYLPPDAAIGTRVEVEVFGEWIGFEVAREPLCDPAGERIRA